MANQKISELPEYTATTPDDLVPVVDVTSGATKRMTVANFTKRAHATLSHSQTLTVAATNAEYAVPYDTQDVLVGITHTLNDSKVYVPKTGTYVVLMSAVVDLSSNANMTFNMWVKVNGQNIARSNTQVQLNNANLESVLAVGFILDLNANDYFQFFYHANSTLARINAIAAQTGPPAIPACPSVILCINRISS